MRFVASSDGVRFLRFQDEPIAEYYNGSMIQRFIPGEGVDETVGGLTSGGSRFWYYADERESPIARAGDAGTPSALYSYDEYGRPTGNAPRIGFTGQLMISSGLLYDFKARFYHAGLGRFLQTDPIGYGGGMNMYAYVKGDPVNFTDPTGLDGEDIVITGRRHCNFFCKVERFFSGDGGNSSTSDSGFDNIGAATPAPVGRAGGRGGKPKPSNPPKSEILDELKDLYCSLPSVGGSTSIRGYDVAGGGLVGEIAFDPQSGNLRVSAGFDVGLGFGGSGGWSSGNSATMGRGVGAGWSGSIGVNANARLGAIAAGAGYTLIGPNHADFNGASAGIRPGGTGATVNANVGARAGYGGQVLPQCGNKK
jgi:RHS repeat-associated protein